MNVKSQIVDNKRIDTVTKDGQVTHVITCEHSVNIESAKAALIVAIKSKAAHRIERVSWQVERAKERAELKGISPYLDDEYKLILQKREDVRAASNSAENKAQALTTIEDVEAFTW